MEARSGPLAPVGGPGVHGCPNGTASLSGASVWPSVAPLGADRPALTEAARRAVSGLRLAPREFRCLDLASHGWANSQIAQGLGVSPRTVTGCLSGLFATLGVPNRAALVAAGFRLGFLSPEPWRGRPRLDPSIQWLAPLLAPIAGRFGCGAPTLRSRLFRLRELLGARDRGHAVRRGVEAGLLAVSPDGARLVLAEPAAGGTS